MGKKKSSDRIPGTKNLKALRGALEHSVTIQLTRMQEVIDELVKRGSLTRAEADNLINQLVETSKAYTQALLEVIETVRAETIKNVESAASPVMATANKIADRVRPKKSKGKAKAKAKNAKDAATKSAKSQVKKAKAAAESTLSLVPHDPIPGLADLSIVKIRPLLAKLTPAELSKVRDQEAAGKSRVSLLAEIDRDLKK